MPKAQVGIGPPIEIRPCRIDEHARITVGSRKHDEDHLPCRHRGVADLRVASGDADRGLHGTDQANHLLECPRGLREVGGQPRTDLGVLGKIQGHVADELGGGLVAGNQQQHARGKQLGIAECALDLVGVHHAGHQIFLRRDPSRGDLSAEVGTQLLTCVTRS